MLLTPVRPGCAVALSTYRAIENFTVATPLFIGGAEKLALHTVLILNGGDIYVFLGLAHLLLSPAE
jgi:hypothetical protein